MKIILDKYEKITLANVAKRHSVNAGKLEKMYYEIMECNFFEDLCDIANENELKESK